jgi:putative membrane protein
MVTWFAGLFYLPRLYVYHAMAEDQTSIDRFKIMERKLLLGIMTPGMLLTLGFGLWMLKDYAWAIYAASGWLHLKLTLIAGLVIFHGFCIQWWLDFRNDQNNRSHQFFRWMNEIPVFFLFAIMILAVVKPF